MNKIINAISILLASVPLGGVASAAMLVANGQPRAEIVIAETPARMTRLAASELQTYIEKISGATLPIVTEPSGEALRIYVGISPHTEALGLDTEGLEHGAYRMASGPDWLALLGPDKDYARMEPWPQSIEEWDAMTPDGYFGFPYSPRNEARAAQATAGLDIHLRDDGGTFNAVCDFLRALGVRWYFPGEVGEIVPEMADIPLPDVNHTARPDFPYRLPSLWHTHTQGNHDALLWVLRLGGFAGQDLHGTTQICHGLKWMIMRDETKEAHPEWYALVRGERSTDHTYAGAPCLTSEGLLEQTLTFKRWLYDEREEPMVSLDPPDGFGTVLCQCEGCAGRGTPERGWSGVMSDYVFDFVHRAAAELYQSHPDRKASALSYSAYALPPRNIEPFSPNLVLWLCQWRSRFHDRNTRAEALQLRQDWLDLLPSGELYMYEYYLHNAERYGYAGIPVYYPRLIAEDLRSLRGISKGELIEVYLHRDPPDFAWHPLAVLHLNLYTTLRLLWDADQDIEAMLDEFYTRFYGPAAAEMKSFIEYAEEHWPRMRTDIGLIEETLARLAAAEEAVTPESVYGQRVGLVSTYMDLLRERKVMLTTYRQDVPVARAAVHTGDTPVIDGRLDKAFWEDIPEHELRDLETGEPTEHRTTFRMAWVDGDRSLVIGIRCEEPDMAGILAGATQDGDPAVFSDDAIELFIETPFHAFYQICVNTRGVVMDLDRSAGLDSLWSYDGEVAVHRGEDYWSLEIRIPTADHVGGGLDPRKQVNGARPTEVEPWFFNVCRMRPRGTGAEKSAFSPTGHSRFGDPAKFARLIAE